MDNNQYYQVQKPKILPKIAILLLIVLAIFGLSLLALKFYQSGGARKVADTFMQQLSQKDSSDTYSSFTDRFKKSYGDENIWKRNLNSSFTSQYDFQFKSQTEVSNPEATYGKGSHPQKIIYDVKVDNNKNYEMYIILVQEKSVWKVDEFNSIQK